MQVSIIGERERANLVVCSGGIFCIIYNIYLSYVVRRVSAHARLRYMHAHTCANLTTVATMDHQSTEDALRRRRERERERRARETPEQREARLSQRRQRDRERAKERLAAETAEGREARVA